MRTGFRIVLSRGLVFLDELLVLVWSTEGMVGRRFVVILRLASGRLLLGALHSEYPYVKIRYPQLVLFPLTILILRVRCPTTALASISWPLC